MPPADNRPHPVHQRRCEKRRRARGIDACRPGAAGGSGHRHHTGAGREHRRRQGAGQRAKPLPRGDLGERHREPHRGPRHPSGQREHQRHARRCVPARYPVPRLRGLPGVGNSARARGLSERRAHQRGVRRHGQLGSHSGHRHPARRHRQLEPPVRPQRARGSHGGDHEKRLHLPGCRRGVVGRLLQPAHGFGRSRIQSGRIRSVCGRAAAGSGRLAAVRAGLTAPVLPGLEPARRRRGARLELLPRGQRTVWPGSRAGAIARDQS